jgi:hypothetical protein
MKIQHILSRIMGTCAVIAAIIIYTPTSHASTDLLSRVPEALHQANIPATQKTIQTYDVCIASGHYTTFNQLVNAMLWQKQHGHTVPDVVKCMDTKSVWKFKGEVTEVNPLKLEMQGTNAKGVFVHPKFDITKHTIIKNGVLLFDADYRMAYEVKDEIRRGSSVTVWATHSNQALIITNHTPHSWGDYYGNVDCPSCQGGTNPSTPTDTTPNDPPQILD